MKPLIIMDLPILPKGYDPKCLRTTGLQWFEEVSKTHARRWLVVLVVSEGGALAFRFHEGDSFAYGG